MSLLSWLLVILAGLSLAAMVVSITIASRSAREARSTIFPIVREEETVRARRARIATSVTGVIAAIMAGAFFLSGQLPSLNVPVPQLPAGVVANVETPVAEKESSAAPTVTPLPPTEEKQTPTRSQLATSTDQPPAEATSPPPQVTSTVVPPTLSPTAAIPTSTLAPSALVPAPATATVSPVPAPTGVQMGPIAFTEEIGDRREPISPTTVFSGTVSQVYAAFPYNGMRNGLTWTHIWYFNDAEFSRGEETWRWGSTDRSYVFTKLVGSGDYRLELLVNDDLVASGAFTVRGPAAVGGPETQDRPEGTATPESP